MAEITRENVKANGRSRILVRHGPKYKKQNASKDKIERLSGKSRIFGLVWVKIKKNKIK